MRKSDTLEHQKEKEINALSIQISKEPVKNKTFKIVKKRTVLIN